MIEQVKVYRGPNAVWQGSPDMIELTYSDGTSLRINVRTNLIGLYDAQGKLIQEVNLELQFTEPKQTEPPKNVPDSKKPTVHKESASEEKSIFDQLTE